MIPIIETCDPGIFIINSGDNFVDYMDDIGNKWRMYGKCNHCGSCWKGSVDMPPDKDSPCRPDIAHNNHDCVLHGEYL